MRPRLFGQNNANEPENPFPKKFGHTEDETRSSET